MELGHFAGFPRIRAFQAICGCSVRCLWGMQVARLLALYSRKPVTMDVQRSIFGRWQREIAEVAVPGFGLDVHHPRRLRERQPPQEKIVDQAEDRRVQSNPTASPARTVRVITARRVNPGDLRNWRRAKRRSVII
jgi:hypothetical protein